MLMRLVALLLGVLVLSVGISVMFDINFLALFAGLFVFLKGFKITFFGHWLLRFLFIRLPQRILTAAVKLYVIDRKTMERIMAWLRSKQQYWREHFSIRLIVFGAIAIVILGISAWRIGLWLLVFYEIEVLLEMAWRKIWPTLSETAFVKAMDKIYSWLKRTRLGRFLVTIDHWLEDRVRGPVEQAGVSQRQRVVTWWNQYLTTLPQPTWQRKERPHHALLTHMIRRNTALDRHRDRRRHQTRKRPRPRR